MENNLVTLEFEALPQNQSFARSVVSAYCAASDPTVEELTEIKTAVSEAATSERERGKSEWSFLSSTETRYP